METIIVGIDPGVTGSIACLNVNGDQFFPMPTYEIKNKKYIDGKQLYKLLDTIQPNIIAIEEVHAMPKQGVTSMFNFGFSYGTIIGVINSLQTIYNVELIKVSPVTWKKFFNLPASDKEAVLSYVGHPLISKETNKNRRISFSESYLIARYAQIKFKL